MNRLIILLIVLICYGNSLRAQEIEYSRPVNTPESCTSILVGKKASADGSVMTSHTCDGNYRTWMEIVPAARYERDTTVAIYNGRMHTEYPADRTNMELKGTIPEARSTYQFLNTAYPCLNEKQLGIGETTISGRKELQNKKGMFMIEELEKIALQRCTTRSDTADRAIGCRTWIRGFGRMPDDRRPERGLAFRGVRRGAGQDRGCMGGCPHPGRSCGGVGQYLAYLDARPEGQG